LSRSPYERQSGGNDVSIAETTIASAGDSLVGPLEARHLESRIYRNAADSTRLTSTHWHIAWANGLG
jgi:hypothetical protein